jgi:hypothetical protein
LFSVRWLAKCQELEQNARKERAEKEEWMTLTTSLRRGLTNRIQQLQKEKEKLEEEREKEQQQREAEEKKRKEEAPECCLCLSASPEMVVLPCLHFCLCSDCASTMMASKTPTCPKCRGPVESIKRLYK